MVHVQLNLYHTYVHAVVQSQWKTWSSDEAQALTITIVNIDQVPALG